MFYFGNAVGDTGNVTSNFWVTSADEIGARNNQGFNRPVTDWYDFNRDKWVNATDQIIARNNQVIGSGALQRITAPIPPGGLALDEPPAPATGTLVLDAAAPTPISALSDSDATGATFDAAAIPTARVGRVLNEPRNVADDYGWLAELLARDRNGAPGAFDALGRSDALTRLDGLGRSDALARNDALAWFDGQMPLDALAGFDALGRSDALTRNDILGRNGRRAAPPSARPWIARWKPCGDSSAAAVDRALQTLWR